jgi:hypothetical protein
MRTDKHIPHLHAVCRATHKKPRDGCSVLCMQAVGFAFSAISPPYYYYYYDWTTSAAVSVYVVVVVGCVDAALLHSPALVSRSTRLQMHLVMCIRYWLGINALDIKTRAVCWFILFIAVHVRRRSANQMFYGKPQPSLLLIKRTREVSHFPSRWWIPLHLSSFMLTDFCPFTLERKNTIVGYWAQRWFTFWNLKIHHLDQAGSAVW